MDADQILEGYLGGKIPVPKGSGTPTTADDILDGYLNADAPNNPSGITIRPVVAPPISGATKEQSDTINAVPSQKGGKNPRRYSEPSNVLGDVAAGASELPIDWYRGMGERARAGIDTFVSAGQDVVNNRPATAVGKAGLGAIQYLTSPFASALDVGVEQPVTKLTGSERAGEAAGLIVGGALPVAKLGKVANAARPVNKAFSDFVEAIGGKDRIPEFLREYTSNPRLSAMDVSPSLLQTTQKLATTPGNHQNLLADVVAQRTGSAKGAVGSAIDNTMGTAVDLKKTEDRLKEKARQTGKTLINPVVSGTPIVDITGFMKGLDKEIGSHVFRAMKTGGNMPPLSPLQNELLKLRKDIRGEWADRPNMAHYTDDLHDIQSRLRVRAERLIKNGGSDANLGHDLMDFRNKLVDTIDTGTSGAYKPALKQYRDDKHIEEAFEKGQDVLKNRPTKSEDDPSYWKHWVQKEATADELAAAREGARVAVDRQIRGMRNAVGQKGTEIPQIEFNKDKLKYLFGDTEVEAMSKKLIDERKIADSNKKLFEGSQTAMRLKADSRVAERTDKGLEGSSLLPYIAEGVGAFSTGLPGIGAATYKAADLAKKHIINPISNRMGDAKNLELSRLASATGSEKDEIVSYLSKLVAPVPKPSIMQKAKLMISP